MATWRFDAIGVPWAIDTPEELPESLRHRISDRIERFDATYSRFRDDSLVATLSRTPGTYTFPDDITALVDIYRQLFVATSGTLNPLVGPALDHWGYDASYRLIPAEGTPPPIPAFSDMLTLEGTTLTAPRPLGLDIGAVGKGYLADCVAELLMEEGLDQGIVDASGDMRHLGGPPERVGLEHPDHPDRVVGAVALEAMSLAASSPSRRTWAPGVHHILDALTGLPTSGIRASWVLAEDCAVADGVATALFTTAPERLEEYFAFHWVVLDADGRLNYSNNFPGEVYP